MSIVRPARSGPGLLICAAAAFAGAAEAQVPPPLQFDQTCGTHCATIQPLKVVGSEDDPELIGWSGPVVVTRGYSFARNGAGDRIIVYDADGRYQAAWGRRGGGPGEFRVVIGLHPYRGDSLIVMGLPTQVFARDGSGSRSLSDVEGGLAVLDSGRIAAATRIRTSRTAGNALHLFTAAGERFHSLLPYEGNVCPACTLPALAESKDQDGFWAFQRNDYTGVRYSSSGEEIQRIRIDDSPWFEPWSMPTPPGDQGKVHPQTTLAGASQDDEGRLWLTFSGPAANWKPAGFELPSTISANDAGSPALRYLESAYATYVDVVDPVAQRVLVSIRMDGKRMRSNGELLWTQRETPLGVWLLDVYEVVLQPAR